jgi:serine/threonine protein kinase
LVRVGAKWFKTAAVPGTLEYMAPEWRNEQVVSYKVDIWAMGVLLTELRTGYTLSDSHMQGLKEQTSHSSTLEDMRQSKSYSRLTDAEWEWVTTCLVYDRTVRPSAKELLDHIYITSGCE